MYDFIFSLYSKVIFGILFAIFLGITFHYFNLRDQNKFLIYLFVSGILCWIFIILFLKSYTFIEPKFKGQLKPNNEHITEHPMYINHINKQRAVLEKRLQDDLPKEIKSRTKKELDNLDSLHSKGFFIFLGNGIVHTFSENFTAIELLKKPVLTIKIKDNSIFISGIFISEDNRISTRLTDNVFSINENNWFSIERPNRYTLILRDNFDKEVLNVNFFNPRAVIIKGIFRLPNSFPLIVNEQLIEYNSNIISDFFLYGIGKVGISIN